MRRRRPRSLPGSAATTRSKYGFHDPENYVFKSQRGLSPEVVDEISAHKNEPDWMRKFRLKALDYFRARPMPDWGGRPLRHRLREHLLLHQADREAGRTPGRTCPPTSRTPGTGSASPRRRRSTSPASAPSTSPRSSTTSSRRSSRGRASSSSTWTRGCVSTRTSSASTSARSSRRTTTSSRR